jgi:hypothetical protein
MEFDDAQTEHAGPDRTVVPGNPKTLVLKRYSYRHSSPIKDRDVPVLWASSWRSKTRQCFGPQSMLVTQADRVRLWVLPDQVTCLCQPLLPFFFILYCYLLDISIQSYIASVLYLLPRYLLRQYLLVSVSLAQL